MYFISIRISHFDSVSKRVLQQSFSYENDFHEKEVSEGAHFHMNGFVARAVLTQRKKAKGNGLLAILHLQATP